MQQHTPVLRCIAWHAGVRARACLPACVLGCFPASAALRCLLNRPPSVRRRTEQRKGATRGAVGRRGPGKGADARSSTTTLLSCGSRDRWGPHGRRRDGMGWGLPPVGVGTEGGRGRGDCRLAWPPETPVDPLRGHRLPHRPHIRIPSHRRVETSHTTMYEVRTSLGTSRKGARTKHLCV